MDSRPDHVTPASAEGKNKTEGSGLEIHRAFSGDKCKLALEGELRYVSSEALYQEIVRAYESGTKAIILDFRTLKYVDTAGLQSLVRVYKYTQDHEGLRFVILVHEGELHDILRTCRFDKFMEITRDEAIAAGDWRQD